MSFVHFDEIFELCCEENILPANLQAQTNDTATTEIREPRKRYLSKRVKEKIILSRPQKSKDLAYTP